MVLHDEHLKTFLALSGRLLVKTDVQMEHIVISHQFCMRNKLLVVRNRFKGQTDVK